MSFQAINPLTASTVGENNYRSVQPLNQRSISFKQHPLQSSRPSSFPSVLRFHFITEPHLKLEAALEQLVEEGLSANFAWVLMQMDILLVLRWKRTISFHLITLLICTKRRNHLEESWRVFLRKMTTRRNVRKWKCWFEELEFSMRPWTHMGERGPQI
jgi:hypothetical protein